MALLNWLPLVIIAAVAVRLTGVDGDKPLESSSFSCRVILGTAVNGSTLAGTQPHFVESQSDCCAQCQSVSDCVAAVYSNSSFVCTFKSSIIDTHPDPDSVVLFSRNLPATPSPTTTTDLYCHLNGGSSCNHCIEQGNRCGWCNETQSCVSADKTFGPSNCPHFVPYLGSCSNPCSSASAQDDCASCLKTTWSCGFCASSSSCMEGGPNGPLNGHHCDAGWGFGNTASSCPNCNTLYVACDTCAAHSSCVWCPNANGGASCWGGDASGIFSGNDCGSDWVYFNTSQCPAPTRPPSSDQRCWAQKNCSSCISQQHSTSTCGWCEAANECMSGDSSGAFNSNCRGPWLWGTCALDCAAHSNCEACSQDSSAECGWCMLTQTCSKGTTSGPDGSQCFGPYWQFGSYACPGCSQYSNCLECQFDAGRGCGFCGSTSKCLEGTPSGPLPMGTTCPASDWMYEHCS